MPLKQASFDFDMPAPEPVASVPANEVETAVALVPELETTPVDLEEMNLVKEPRQKISRNKPKSVRGRMRLSDMEAHAGKVEIPEDDVLFEKRYYTISAVSDMFKVNNSLIRFWTNEFSIIKPKINGKGDRLFRPEDIKNLHIIYKLLREKKYTIEGAKEYLKRAKYAEERFAMAEAMKKLKNFMIELKATL